MPEYLYKRFPDKQEGELSVIKSVIVSAKYLAKASKRLALDELVITGKGIPAEKLPKSILANAFESIIAAMFLDAGFDRTAAFIGRLFAPLINAVPPQTHGPWLPRNPALLQPPVR